MADDFRLPTNQQRLAVIGKTGSGKSLFGAWALSQAPFDRMPYVVIDYKGDELFGAVTRIRELALNEVPKKPGLYTIRPLPHEQEAVEQWLWKIWSAEKIGLFVDEGYSLPDKGAFQAILTQGRSKRIPVTCLTQRPAWLSRFVFSEADFFAVFNLNDRDDQLKVQRFTPRDRMDLAKRLPDYHSYWYDVSKDKVFIMKPVPDAASIVQMLDDRLTPKRRTF